MVNACLPLVQVCLAAGIAAGIAAGTCRALPGDFHPAAALPLPEWATQEWIYDAAGIVAGETVHRCAECDRWIACTVVGDVTLRGYHPWRLRPAEAGAPGRWHGWKRPSERHLEAIRTAVGGGCAIIPECAYLGSLSDYTGHWRYGLASEQQVLAIGNRHGVLICVP